MDPYVVFALNEETDKGPKEGAIALERAVDRARSSTAWSKSIIEQFKEKARCVARCARADPLTGHGA